MWTLVTASNEAGLEVNADKIKYRMQVGVTV